MKGAERQQQRRLNCSKCGEDLGFSEGDPCESCTVAFLQSERSAPAETECANHCEHTWRWLKGGVCNYPAGSDRGYAVACGHRCAPQEQRVELWEHRDRIINSAERLEEEMRDRLTPDPKKVEAGRQGGLARQEKLRKQPCLACSEGDHHRCVVAVLGSGRCGCFCREQGVEPPELLPCPFCGKQPKSLISEHEVTRVRCGTLGCPMDLAVVRVESWNTRATPAPATTSAPGEVEKMPLCAVHTDIDRKGKLELGIYSHSCLACALNQRNEMLKMIEPFIIGESEDAISVLERILHSPDEAAQRRAAFDEAIAIVRDEWLAAYPLDVFPEPPPPPAECARDLIAAAMGRHMAIKLIEQLSAARDRDGVS